MKPERQRVGNVLAYLLAHVQKQMPGSHALTNDGARPNLKSAERGRAFFVNVAFVQTQIFSFLSTEQPTLSPSGSQQGAKTSRFRAIRDNRRPLPSPKGHDGGGGALHKRALLC